MVRAADRMDDRNAPQLPRRHPRILPVDIQTQAGARPSGRRAAQGTRATRAPRPGPAPLLSYLLNQGNVLCLDRNHLFRSIRLRFAHNALPTQRNLPNWLVREQLMEAIKANLLSHQIGSFSQRSRYWSRFVTPTW